MGVLRVLSIDDYLDFAVPSLRLASEPAPYSHAEARSLAREWSSFDSGGVAVSDIGAQCGGRYRS